MRITGLFQKEGIQVEQPFREGGDCHEFLCTLRGTLDKRSDTVQGLFHREANQVEQPDRVEDSVIKEPG